MSASESLGKMFQEKRKKLGLEREDVSAKTFINIAVISDIESGVFDKLSSVYMKSFIKKYSQFLGLDESETLKQYESVVLGVPVKSFSLQEKPVKKEKGDVLPKVIPVKKEKKSAPAASISVKKAKKPSPLRSIPMEKRLQIAAVTMLTLILVGLIVVFIKVTQKVLNSPPREVAVMADSRAQSSIFQKSVKEGKSVSSDPKSMNSSVKNNGKITLALKATDRVWVQVASDEQGKLFDGFLNAGDSRTWQANGVITVWTGKASVLNFIVNGQELGVVATGVVRNIKVSAEGVLVGEDWFKRF